MSTPISIPCPTCQSQIPADSKQLVLGIQFSCPNCQSVIGLAEESKPMVKDAMEKYLKLKEEINKKRD